MRIEKENCTGCGACAAVCPKGSIVQKTDDLGFFYPEIRGECVHCGACDRVCPALQISEGNKENLYHPMRSYIGVHKKQDVIMSCSSGGAFPAIVTAFFGEQGGTLFAASFDDNWHLFHRAYKVGRDEYEQAKKSKYIQSDIWQCYAEVEKLLNRKEKVLFVGTPCQVAGLHTFLKKEYSNFLSVDLICNGVASPRFLQTHINMMSKKRKKKVADYCFRAKKPDATGRWDVMQYRITYSDESTETSDLFNNLFHRIYQKRLFYRASCYQCPYKQSNRPGDITIGDWWEPHGGNTNYQKGASVLLLNTSKALLILKGLHQLMRLQSVEYTKIIKQQPALRKPQTLNNTPQMSMVNEKQIQKQMMRCSVLPLQKFILHSIKIILPGCLVLLIDTVKANIIKNNNKGE